MNWITYIIAWPGHHYHRSEGSPLFRPLHHPRGEPERRDEAHRAHQGGALRRAHPLLSGDARVREAAPRLGT